MGDADMKQIRKTRTMGRFHFLITTDIMDLKYSLTKE